MFELRINPKIICECGAEMERHSYKKVTASERGTKVKMDIYSCEKCGEQVLITQTPKNEYIEL